MDLNYIKQKSILDNKSVRVAFRLNHDDLNTFRAKLKNIEIKIYFENCIKYFLDIQNFKDVKQFYYKYTKDKSYTIVLNHEIDILLHDLSKNLNLSKSDILRYILLKTINK